MRTETTPGGRPLLESDLIPYSAASSIGAPPVLVLAPHPDDEVLGCAGAIVAHRQAGNPVDVIIVTDGRLGVLDPNITDGMARALRAEESERAALILGYGTPQFWGYPDRGLTGDQAFVERLCACIFGGRYQSVFAPSPLEIHPDHRALALAMLAVAARREHRFELCFYEVGVPLYPNRLLDITNSIQTKRDALACFASQLGVQNYHLQIEGLNAFRSYTLPQNVSHAEAYCVLDSEQIVFDPTEDPALPPFGRPDLDAGVRALRQRIPTER